MTASPQLFLYEVWGAQRLLVGIFRKWLKKKQVLRVRLIETSIEIEFSHVIWYH